MCLCLKCGGIKFFHFFIPWEIIGTPKTAWKTCSLINLWDASKCFWYMWKYTLTFLKNLICFVGERMPVYRLLLLSFDGYAYVYWYRLTTFAKLKGVEDHLAWKSTTLEVLLYLCGWVPLIYIYIYIHIYIYTYIMQLLYGS